MYIVRFRTHGPWQQEEFSDRMAGSAVHPAYIRAIELAKSYAHVSICRVSDMREWKDGSCNDWHND